MAEARPTRSDEVPHLRAGYDLGMENNAAPALAHIRRYASAVRTDAWALLDAYMAGTLPTIRTEAVVKICARYNVRPSDVYDYMMR